MNPQTRRIIYSMALLVWSAVLLYFYAGGRINKYLATDFRPLALIGGLGLAVVGLFNLLTAWNEVDCGHDHGEADDPHDHENGETHPLAAFLLMVVPIAFSVAWTKDAYSIAALSRKGLYDSPVSGATPFFASSMQPLTLEEIEKSHRKTPEGYIEFNLMELFYATGDRELQTIIDGLKVETVGRWIDEKMHNPNSSRKRLYRLFLTCCAADSRPIPIILEFGAQPPDFPENDWVKVSGIMRFPSEEGSLKPILIVEHVTSVTPPQEENFMRK